MVLYVYWTDTKNKVLRKTRIRTMTPTGWGHRKRVGRGSEYACGRLGLRINEIWNNCFLFALLKYTSNFVDFCGVAQCHNWFKAKVDVGDLWYKWAPPETIPPKKPSHQRKTKKNRSSLRIERTSMRSGELPHWKFLGRGIPNLKSERDIRLGGQDNHLTDEVTL